MPQNKFSCFILHIAAWTSFQQLITEQLYHYRCTNTKSCQGKGVLPAYYVKHSSKQGELRYSETFWDLKKVE